MGYAASLAHGAKPAADPYASGSRCNAKDTSGNKKRSVGDVEELVVISRVPRGTPACEFERSTARLREREHGLLDWRGEDSMHVVIYSPERGIGDSD